MAETIETAVRASDARIAELEAEVERLRAAPKVKPLEWEEIYDDALAGGVVAHAETVFGTYRAWGTGSWSAPSGKHGKHDGNLDKAKVSAQADYEARILSALVQP
jgi:hypothetical protein